MKSKRIFQILAIGGLMATAVQAQSFYPDISKFSTTDKERMDKNFAAALKSDNEGLVESALTIVTKVKLSLPDEQYQSIREEIEKLTGDGTTPSIRYKAYIAEAVFTDPSIFREETGEVYANGDALFSALAQRMARAFLSSK